MKALVIFSSKYGSTEKYSRWIAEGLNIDIARIEDAKKLELGGYSTIILAGYVYNFEICPKIKEFIKNNSGLLLKKNLGVLVVGGAPQDGMDLEGFKRKSFPKEIIGHIFAFGYAQGAMYPDKFDLADGIMMRIGSMMMPDKVKIAQFDYVKRENIEGFMRAIEKKL